MEKTKDPFLAKLAEADAKKNDLLTKVKNIVQAGDSPPADSFTSSEYASFTNLSQGQARAHLRRLEREGKIKTISIHDKGKKYYRLVDAKERDQRLVE